MLVPYSGGRTLTLMIVITSVLLGNRRSRCLPRQEAEVRSNIRMKMVI